MHHYDEEREIINVLQNKDNGSETMRIADRITLLILKKIILFSM